MQKVISNSSPLIHLFKIGYLGLLKDYFQKSEAIALALEINADLILLDDLDARERARIYDLQITGTVGILLRAKLEGKIVSLKDILRKLRKTGFWINNELMQELLKFAGEI